MELTKAVEREGVGLAVDAVGKSAVDCAQSAVADTPLSELDAVVRESVVAPSVNAVDGRQGEDASGNSGSFGKFKSVDELVNAYAQLEKSFTKKCMELSALRKETGGSGDGAAASGGAAGGAVASGGAASGGAASGAAASGGAASGAVASGAASAAKGVDEVIAAAADERVQRLVLAKYLRGLNQRSVRLMSSKDGGGFAITPPHAPRTVEEAGRIAGKYFKG